MSTYICITILAQGIARPQWVNSLAPRKADRPFVFKNIIFKYISTTENKHWKYILIMLIYFEGLVDDKLTLDHVKFFSIVFFPQKTGDLYAVKTFNSINPHRAAPLQKKEFDLLRRLNHSNIVKLLTIESEVGVECWVRSVHIKICTVFGKEECMGPSQYKDAILPF